MVDPDSGAAYFVSTDKKGRRQSFWTMEELQEVVAADGVGVEEGAEGVWAEGTGGQESGVQETEAQVIAADARIVEAIDEASGSPYFTDTITGASFWTLEEALQAVASEGDGASVDVAAAEVVENADVVDPIMVAAMKIMKEKDEVRRQSFNASMAAAAALEVVRAEAEAEQARVMAVGGAGPMGGFSDSEDGREGGGAGNDEEQAREAVEADQITNMMKEFLMEQGNQYEDQAQPGGGILQGILQGNQRAQPDAISEEEAAALLLRRKIEEAEAEAEAEPKYDEVLTGKQMKSAARTSRLGVQLSETSSDWGAAAMVVKSNLNRSLEHAKSGFMQKCGPKGPDDFRRRFFRLNLETKELVCTIDNPATKVEGDEMAESNQWILSPEKGMQRVQKGEMITKEKAREAKLIIPLRGSLVRVRPAKSLFHEFEILEACIVSTKGLTERESPSKKQGRLHVLRADSERELVDWMVLLKKGTQQNSRQATQSPASSHTSPNKTGIPNLLSPTGSSGGSPAAQRRVSFTQEDPQELGKVLTAEEVRAQASALVDDEVYDSWKEKMKLGNLSCIIYTKDGRSKAEVITVDSIRGGACLTWGGRLTSTGFLNKGNSMNLSNATQLALMERAGTKLRSQGRVGGKALPLVGARAEFWAKGMKARCSREQGKAAQGHEVRVCVCDLVLGCVLMCVCSHRPVSDAA
jgi:hypothetical protein